jgi:hypothetical protein
METLERGFEDATAIIQLPERYRKRLRTNKVGSISIFVKDK